MDRRGWFAQPYEVLQTSAYATRSSAENDTAWWSRTTLFGFGVRGTRHEYQGCNENQLNDIALLRQFILLRTEPCQPLNHHWEQREDSNLHAPKRVLKMVGRIGIAPIVFLTCCGLTWSICSTYAKSCKSNIWGCFMPKDHLTHQIMTCKTIIRLLWHLTVA